IIIDSDGNIIGGAYPGAGNLFAGLGASSSDNAIRIGSTDGTHGGNRVEGNFFNTDITGLNRIGTFTPIQVSGSPNNLILRNVVTTPPTFPAINIKGAGFQNTTNTIIGNSIGVTADGGATVGSPLNGIMVSSINGTSIGGGGVPDFGNLIGNCAGDAI